MEAEFSASPTAVNVEEVDEIAREVILYSFFLPLNLSLWRGGTDGGGKCNWNFFSFSFFFKQAIGQVIGKGQFQFSKIDQYTSNVMVLSFFSPVLTSQKGKEGRKKKRKKKMKIPNAFTGDVLEETCRVEQKLQVHW